MIAVDFRFPMFMKRLFLTVLVSTILGLRAFAQTAPIYENLGSVDFNSEPPQIDALAFVNRGLFSVGSSLPFDFNHTRYFTNFGIMSGTVGFRFDTASNNTKRQPASTFINHRGAVVTASNFGFFPVQGTVFSPISFSGSPSYVLVNTTNIENHGFISAGAGGLVRLEGQNVNLERGGLEIAPLRGGNTFVTSSNFFPDPGLYDLYWGLTNGFMSANGIFSGSVTQSTVTVPPHLVTNNLLLEFTSFVGFQVSNPASFVYTNDVTETNKIVQAVFVASSDPNISTAVRFSDSPLPTNFFKTVVVELSLPETNVVTDETIFHTLYLKDELASFTNITILTNLLFTTTPTARPATYGLQRTPFPEFIDGFESNGIISSSLLYNASFSNLFLTNLYASYSVRVDPLVSQPEAVQGLEVTELPGRVEVIADQLDLRGTRMRGNGLISVKANHLIGSTNAQVDSLNLSFDLAVRNGTLRIQNLGKEEVRRLGGTMRAWSAIWTNLSGILATNQVEEPPGSGTFTNAVVTNVVEIGFHVLVLDATGLRGSQRVSTHDFASRGENVVMNDSLEVVKSFKLDTERFTLTGRLSLSQRAERWRATNAPILKYFTNEGTLLLQNTAEFGNDRLEPYVNWINRGTTVAASHSIRTLTFENNGVIESELDGLRIETESGTFQNGGNITRGDVYITASDLKFHSYTNVTQRGLHLDVSGSLTDSGSDSGNIFSVRDGINLFQKPINGDLLGTTIQSTAPRFAAIDHIWAAEDRGATVSGFQDNVTIGRLVLNTESRALLRFLGPGANNALYVDFLELAGGVLSAFSADDLGAVLEIDPNFVIYFADANVPVDQLNGALGGRLRWVSDFAGPNSSVDVILRSENRTIQVNRALRESTSIDSDNDGIVNQSDAFPFDPDMPGVALKGAAFNKSSSEVSFGFEAQPGATYIVEISDSLDPANWRLFREYTNTGKTVKTLVIQDQAKSQRERYYRVRPQ